MIAEEPRVDAAKVTELAKSLETELARLIVGQKALVRDTVISLIAGGHVLLEGVPGLGKTVLVRSLGQALSMSFSRIQFTPDLLPEAQLDRFFFKVLVPFPGEKDLLEIARRTTGESTPQLRAVADAQTVLAAQLVAREVPIAEHVLLYAARLIGATHPDRTELDGVRRYVRWGASPRGLQTLVLGAKVRALLEGRYNVAFDDLSAVAPPALRHRIFLQFEAEADGISADRLIADILEHTVKESARA